MKPRRRIVLYMACLVMDVPVWVVAMILSLTFGTKRRVVSHGKHGPVLLVAVPKKIMGWRSGMTICHTIFLSEDRFPEEGEWNSLLEHESVHVEQFEAAMLRSAVVGLAAGSWGQMAALGMTVWSVGALMMFLSASATAWLRGESFYRGAHHEEAAYALEDREVN